MVEQRFLGWNGHPEANKTYYQPIQPCFLPDMILGYVPFGEKQKRPFLLKHFTSQNRKGWLKDSPASIGFGNVKKKDSNLYLLVRHEHKYLRVKRKMFGISIHGMGQ